MGSSTSSETPPTDTEEKLRARVAEIFAEEKRKVNESRAAQAARDERIKDLMRDVIKESEANKKSSSTADESGPRNAMIIKTLTELLASRGNDPDKSKMINYLLDMQQQLSSSEENAFFARFIEKQLEALQSTQDMKITFEKRSSASSASDQHPNVGIGSAGPSSGAPIAGSSAQANAPPLPMPLPNIPPRPFPAHSEGPPSPMPPPNIPPTPFSAHSEGPNHRQDLFCDEVHFGSHAPNPNVGIFPIPPPSYTETLHTDRMQQQGFQPPPPPRQHYHQDNRQLHNPQQNYHNMAPPQNYAYKQFSNEGQSGGQFQGKPFQEKTQYKGNVRTQDNQNYAKKNQERQAQNNATYKNNQLGNDNGPFLDKGPLLQDKEKGCRVEKDPLGNFYVKVPPSLMDFSNRGSYTNHGPNRGHGRGRGGPDPRRSESPHHTQQNRYPNREESFPGPNQDTIPNHRGGFQYRGRGPRRPMQFASRGNYPQRGHFQHYQGPGGHDNVHFGAEEPFSHREHFDPRFKQNEPGGHQTRPSRPGRWNHSNPNTRSASQPRARNFRHSQEMPSDQEKGDDQATDNKQGNKGPRGGFRPRGAFRKGKPKEGGPKPKSQQTGQERICNTDPQGDGNLINFDSDRESVTSDVSTKTQLKSNFKEGVYIIREDGTIFTTVESMGDVNAGEVKKKKKKRNKPKNKLKKAVSATNLSVPQNDVSDEDSQSDGNEVPVTGGKEEDATSPLKLFLGGLDDKALENFKPDEILGHSIVLIAKVDTTVKSYHPTTVGELVGLKKKHPNAEVIVVS